MERLLKNVTENDIINFDYIKRNDICLTDSDIKKIDKLFSSRESFEILNNAYSRITCGDDSLYSKNINLAPSAALDVYKNYRKYHIFNNPLYRYFNYYEILGYVRKNVRVYRILNKFENENSPNNSIHIFARHKKIFNIKYNLDYTLKIQNILLEKILYNKNITADELIDIINNFIKENKLKNIKVRREPIVNLIKIVNKLPNVYTDIDLFIEKYKDVRYSYKAEFMLKETGFKDLKEALLKLPFFSLRLSIANENEKRQNGLIL